MLNSESEIKEKVSNLNFPIQSVTRLINKDKATTFQLALQLLNNSKEYEIFKFTKLLDCIIVIEPQRKSNDPPQYTNCQSQKSYQLLPRCVNLT